MPRHEANQAPPHTLASSNEDTWRQHCQQLEEQLTARTAELDAAHAQLQAEIGGNRLHFMRQRVAPFLGGGCQHVAGCVDARNTEFLSQIGAIRNVSRRQV